jgi:hypothetical protein
MKMDNDEIVDACGHSSDGCKCPPNKRHLDEARADEAKIAYSKGFEKGKEWGHNQIVNMKAQLKREFPSIREKEIRENERAKLKNLLQEVLSKTKKEMADFKKQTKKTDKLLGTDSITFDGYWIQRISLIEELLSKMDSDNKV